MTDVLSRLDGAVDTTATAPKRTIDRRQLLRAGAWAAPAIILMTPAPAAAATSTTPKEQAAITGDVLSFSSVTMTGGPNPIIGGTVNHKPGDKTLKFSIDYNNTLWGPNAAPPTSVTVSYVLQINGSTVSADAVAVANGSRNFNLVLNAASGLQNVIITATARATSAAGVYESRPAVLSFQLDVSGN